MHAQSIVDAIVYGQQERNWREGRIESHLRPWSIFRVIGIYNFAQSLKLHNIINMIIQQQAKREHFVCNFSVLAMAYTLVVVKDSRKLREARLKQWVEINFEGIFLYQCFHKMSKVEPI